MALSSNPISITSKSRIFGNLLSLLKYLIASFVKGRLLDLLGRVATGIKVVLDKPFAPLACVESLAK